MPDQDRTEAPTPKRRKEARDRGQVARSAELPSAAVLAGGLLALTWMGPRIADSTAGAMRACFAQIANGSAVTSAAGLHGLMEVAQKVLLGTLAPIAGICLAAAVLSNVAQVGLHPSLKALQPQFGRLNPAAGFKRVFGKQVGFETGKALAKVVVVGGIAALTLIPDVTRMPTAVGTTPEGLASQLSGSARSVIMRVLIVYIVITVADYLWQRRTVGNAIKMTKQEVKDESRNADLPPEIKQAIRRRQILAARARMMAAVPHADVVVTNPTHYAVALSYDGSKPAPVVVAKGKNLVAAQIRRIAAEHEIPIVPDPPLARSLHATVEIDQMIPAELYAAVAQVLAFVYRMAARRKVAV